MAGKRWSDAETARLRELFPTHTLSEIAADIGRSAVGVEYKIAYLGLRRTAKQRSELSRRSMLRRPRGVVLRQMEGRV